MGPCQILTLGLTGAALKLPGCFWEPSGKLLGSLRMLLGASGAFWLKTFAGAYRSFPGTFREALGGLMATDSLWEASGKVFFNVESL